MLMPKMVIMMVLKQPNATSKAKNPVKVGSKCNISSKNSVSDIRKKATLTPYGQCPKKGHSSRDDLPKDTELRSKNARVDDSPLKLSPLKTSKRNFPTFIPNSTCTKRAK